MSSAIDTELRSRLLELLPPIGWQLLAELFDNGAVKTGAARDAVAVEEFMTDLIQNDEFLAAYKKQLKERAESPNE